MKQNNPRIIGITGGIGTGKSTVSRMLGEFGAVVVDADRIAKEVVAKGSKALYELVDSFGDEILNEAGELDRKKLAAIVFTDSQKLNELNAITHKYVVERMISDIHALRQSDGARLIVLDVPVPVKHGFLDCVDEVWVVLADPDTRAQRVMERSGWTREEVLHRISSQMSDEEYIKIADKIIRNSGSLEELKIEVQRFYFD